MDSLPQIMGAIGLLCITSGIFIAQELRRDLIFILGGSLLLVYSITLKDPVFIPLQIIFILASGFNILRRRRHTKKR